MADKGVGVELRLNLNGAVFTQAAAAAAQGFIAQMAEMAKAAQDSGVKAEAAFAGLGQKSAGALRSEVDKTSAAYQAQGKAAADSAQRQQTAAEQAAQSTGALKSQLAATAVETQKQSDATGKFQSSGEGVAAMLRVLGPLIATTFSAQSLVQTLVAQQALERGYAAIFSTQKQAALEMEFIKRKASELGVEVQGAAQSYMQLAASTKGSTLEGQATREVWEAVTRAMGVLGKSDAEVSRALIAIAQMASKGTVAMEELRGQLGESLPGALQAAANGAGITVKQLTTLVESGNLAARDMLPALTKGLNNLYANGGPPDTIIANWARFKNALNDSATALGEGGGTRSLSAAASYASLAVQAVSLKAAVAGTAIGEFAAKVATGNWELGTAAQKLEEANLKLARNAVAYGIASEAQKALAASSTLAADEVKRLANAQAALVNPQQDVAASALRVGVALAEAAKSAAQYTEVAQRKVEANKAESAALTALVAIYGTDAERRQTAVKVAQDEAAAADALAKAKREEARIATELVEQKKQEAYASGKVTDEARKEIAQKEILATVSRAEAETAESVAKVKLIEAEASKVAAVAAGENAAKVWLYHGAMIQAKIELEKLILAQKAGTATDEDVARGKLKVASATALYRDALADVVKQADLELQQAQRSGQLGQGDISVRLERARAAKELAIATGDSAGAIKAEGEITAATIEGHRQAAETARAEAKAIRDKADATEREAIATGTLNAAKKEEIAAMRTSAQLKEQEAEKSDILRRKTEELANSESNRIRVKEEEISLAEKALQLKERERRLAEIAAGKDSQGFALDASGNRVTSYGATSFGPRSENEIISYIAGYLGAEYVNSSEARAWATKSIEATNFAAASHSTMGSFGLSDWTAYSEQFYSRMAAESSAAASAMKAALLQSRSSAASDSLSAVAQQAAQQRQSNIAAGAASIPAFAAADAQQIAQQVIAGIQKSSLAGGGTPAQSVRVQFTGINGEQVAAAMFDSPYYVSRFLEAVRASGMQVTSSI